MNSLGERWEGQRQEGVLVESEGSSQQAGGNLGSNQTKRGWNHRALQERGMEILTLALENHWVQVTPEGVCDVGCGSFLQPMYFLQRTEG